MCVKRDMWYAMCPVCTIWCCAKCYKCMMCHEMSSFMCVKRDMWSTMCPVCTVWCCATCYECMVRDVMFSVMCVKRDVWYVMCNVSSMYGVMLRDVLWMHGPWCDVQCYVCKALYVIWDLRYAQYAQCDIVRRVMNAWIHDPWCVLWLADAWFMTSESCAMRNVCHTFFEPRKFKSHL